MAINVDRTILELESSRRVASHLAAIHRAAHPNLDVTDCAACGLEARFLDEVALAIVMDRLDRSERQARAASR